MRVVLAVTTGALLALSVFIVGCLPSIAAGGLLHPSRHPVVRARPSQCESVTFQGADVRLEGWRCRPAGPARGTVVYLHGIADNRGSAAGVIQRLTGRGFEVIAYDSRAHGESEGSICTYGFFEKEDLKRVLDTVTRRPIILMGTSLGAAVAIQEAADDSRVSAVVAAEVFSDLRTVATERAPSFLSGGTIARAFRHAERVGHFTVDDVSPMRSAARIRVPVFLIHGAADRETPPDHSRRVLAQLRGPKRLLLVDGAHHNESLNSETVWLEIDAWLDAVVLPYMAAI